jgi:7,8-dihydropterin-6-yl-methyl-4-(beta-D-ribofuranosyl)aminobenzene 5'-phosphate synthase
VYFLGEVPRKNNFEQGAHKGDDMRDDSAIAIKTSKGAFIISGCSHSGICNMCEYAKQVTGQKLHGAMGGFHLFENDKKAVEGTLNYFKSEKVPHLYPMHCVDFPTMAQFHHAFGCKKYAAGNVISIDI